MHENKREALIQILRGLPVAMAKNSASICGIHLDRLLDKRNAKGGTREIVANYGLKMGVQQAAPGRERGKPGRRADGSRRFLFRWQGRLGGKVGGHYACSDSITVDELDGASAGNWGGKWGIDS